MIANKIDFFAERIIKILTPVIFFLPLITNSSFYFPFITPRNFIFRLLVSLLFGLYLVLVVRNKNRYKPIFSKFVIAYLLLAIILTVSSLINGDFLFSFWGNYERMDGLLNYYYLIGFLIVILGTYRSKKAWLYLLAVSVFSSFILSFIGLSQHLGANFLLASSGGERVSATLGNPTYLATFSLFNIFFAAYLFFKENRSKLKMELFGFYILDIAAIIMEIIARRAGESGILTATFTNPLLAVFFIAPQIFVNIDFYVSGATEKIKKMSKRFFYLSVGLINFVALFNTQTRGALVGLLVGLIAVLIFLSLSKYLSKIRRSIAATCLLALVLFGSIVYFFGDNDFVQKNPTLSRMASISISDVTTESRLLTWKVGLIGFSQKPILGWGAERFNVVFNKYFPAEIYKDSGSRVWFDRPHNAFLQQLDEAGALGFIAYIGIFFYLLRSLYQHYRRGHDVKTISIFGGLIVGYAVQNFFVFDSFNTYILFILLLAVITFITSSEKKYVRSQAGSNWLAIVLLLVSVGLGYWSNIPVAKANYDFVAAYREFRSGLTNGVNEELNDKMLSIIDRHFLGRYELRQVYAEMTSDLVGNPLISPEQSMAMVADAEDQLLKSLAEQPDNVRHNIFLVNLYSAAADFDPVYNQKNIELINKSLPLSPTRAQLYFSLGRAYMSQRDPDNALVAFKKGLDLNPDVFDSYTNLLAVYLTIDDQTQAQAVLEQMQQNVELKSPHFSRIAEIYDAFAKQEEALDWLDKGIQINPDDILLISQAIIFSVRYSDATSAGHYLDLLEAQDPQIAATARQSIDKELPGFLK